MTQQLQRTALTGEVLLPGDDGYDEAARAFMAEGAPALVVRPAHPGRGGGGRRARRTG